MALQLTLEGDAEAVTILARRPVLRCRIGDREYTVEEVEGAEPGRCVIRLDGRDYPVWRLQEAGRVHLRLAGRNCSVDLQEPTEAVGSAGSQHELRAEMPGTVVALRCAAGHPVSEGQGLITIESMKMQITLQAPRAGVVAVVHVALNETFHKGTLLLALHPEEAP